MCKIINRSAQSRNILYLNWNDCVLLKYSHIHSYCVSSCVFLAPHQSLQLGAQIQKGVDGKVDVRSAFHPKEMLGLS